MKEEHREEYNEDTQRLLISFMLSDKNAFALSQNIIKPDYFDARLQTVVRFIVDYAQKYNNLPSSIQVKADTGQTIDYEPSLSEHSKWYIDTIEKFCRYKALEIVVMEGPDLIQKGQGAEVEKRVREAMTISLMKDLGTSYFNDPKSRLERMKDRSDFTTTGWTALDEKLYGGFTRGALNVFCGGSGSGKSLFLQNLALNWVTMGMNVVYFSLELSEDLVSMRMDSMMTAIPTKEIFKRIDETDYGVRQVAKRSGDLRIKKMPEAGTTSNDIRAYLKEYEIQTGRKPDCVLIDYLDLMYPNNSKVDPGNLFTKDKFTSEEMRALAGENNYICVTASQLNRQSVEAQEFDHSHIAGGISKINTADNVFGIFTSQSMKDRGEYEIQFLKTRSAAAVGQKIKLAISPNMRISDFDDGGLPQKKLTVAETVKELKSAVSSSVAAPTLTPVEVPSGSSLSRTLMEGLIQKTRGNT